MRKRFFSLTDKKGFTLVEVIISIGFLGIVCGIIIQLFIASGELRSRTALHEIASLKASNAIEACRISVSPGEVGREFFNQNYTDYEKINDGYIIREYFNEDWQAPSEGVAPEFVVKIEITEKQKNMTASGFGEGGNTEEQIISGLYQIIVTSSYLDKSRSDGVLAEFRTSRHYVFKESGE